MLHMISFTKYITLYPYLYISLTKHFESHYILWLCIRFISIYRKPVVFSTWRHHFLKILLDCWNWGHILKRQVNLPQRYPTILLKVVAWLYLGYSMNDCLGYFSISHV